MIEAFPDRRDQLFGREKDIHCLTARARYPGLTAVVARPLMGKTWTLQEVARRLLGDDLDIVGYHELTGAEPSHLLYAVSNLYAHWLADSTLRSQAISMWKRHKDTLLPRIGKMVGTLFDKLGGNLLPGGVGAVVGAAFKGLAEAQKDLLAGGISLNPLPYDQALSLVKLVAEVSDRHVVLILDAWEKSPSSHSEFATLETFLRHLEDWPHTHVFLAVRNPQVNSTKPNDEGYRRTLDLCKISSAALPYELGPMNQDDAKERARLVSFAQSRVPALKGLAEQRILDMVAGYPGVLDFWTQDSTRTAMRTEDDLRKQADNAQALRYVELDQLLSALQDTQRTLAGRLAFFPRLDVDGWMIYRDFLLTGLTDGDATFDDLIDGNVLMNERIPTYGHGTRHAAARSWFIKNKPAFFWRISEQFIEALASRFTSPNSTSSQYIAALTAFSETSRQVGTDPVLCCLLDAAQALFDDVEAISRSEFDDFFPKAVQRNRLFVPLIAWSLFVRGIAKGRRGDYDGAIADYTAAIELPSAQADDVARALIMRGITKGKYGDYDGAFTDCTAAIELPDAQAEQVANAHVCRGVMKGKRGDNDGAIADYTAAIELPGAQANDVARALVERGYTKGVHGDYDGAIADWTAAIELPSAPAMLVSNALVHRGGRKEQRGDNDGAIADWTAAIELPGAPAEPVARALFNRGCLKKRRGDTKGAIADWSAVIEVPSAPAQVVKAARVQLAEPRTSE